MRTGLGELGDINVVLHELLTLGNEQMQGLYAIWVPYLQQKTQIQGCKLRKHEQKEEIVDTWYGYEKMAIIMH